MKLSLKILSIGMACIALIISLQSCAPLERRMEWRLYRKKFINSSGRVIDNTNQNMSHSEGQGYAMLLACHYNDPETFELLRSWTFQNLRVRSDKLFAWKWEDGSVKDSNNATDGDLLIAWALLRAGKKWKKQDYIESAKEIAQAIRKRCIRSSPWGIVLLPGLSGFESDGLTINLSYWIFPALQEIQTIDPVPEWDQLIQSGKTILRTARMDQYQLPSDWILLSNPPSFSPKFPPLFGYDAIRIPLYLLWSKQLDGDIIQPFADFFEKNNPPPATINLQNSQKTFSRSSQGFQAISLWTQAIYKKKKFHESDFPLLFRKEDYFSASLLLLTKMAFQEQKYEKN